MGSCASVHLLYSNYYNNNFNECFICWENFSNVYVKCRVCKITLHQNCALRYINNSPNPQCPHCQRKKALYLFKNEECYLLE